MRDIKFRAWDKNAETLVNVKTLEIDEKGVACVVDFDGISLDRSECEIMQYTGLKDKNGVGIFEGDIVTTSVPMFRDKKLTVKVYEKGGCFLLSGSNTHVNLINVASDSIQVIGNIYENKELLEEN